MPNKPCLLRRARYTSHLAECASCHVQLVSASGANISEVSVPQRLRESLAKLGALFSPGPLRYAVPALTLFIAWSLHGQDSA